MFETNKDKFENGGGDTLILFDKTKITHSKRVFGKRKKTKKIITNLDLNNAFSIFKNNKKKILNNPPYGMYI